MKIGETAPDVNALKISDNDLIKLSEYHAYLNPEVSKVIEVNGNEFKIIDTIFDTNTGMEAFLVKEAVNIYDNDFSIIFVSSQYLKEGWGITDPKLLNDMDKPEQIEAARTYFDRTEKVYGTGAVIAVTGISLAGALANAIALKHPHVRSVTLNPAMLPNGMTNPEYYYSNITNYYSKFDFLTNTQETLGLGNLVPGNKYHIHNGLPASSTSVGIYASYVDRTDSEYKVPVGTKGKAGYGFIHVGADDHIITSLWTGVPLYGGPTTKINIDQSRMYTLASSLETKVIERVMIADGYVEKANEIVLHEREQFNRRVIALEQQFSETVELGTGAYSAIAQLHDLLSAAEEKARFLDGLLHSESIERSDLVDIQMARSLSAVRYFVNQANDYIGQFIKCKQSIMNQDIPGLFKDENSVYEDAVSGELTNHYVIVYDNVNRVLAQLKRFKLQAEDTASQFGQMESGESESNQRDAEGADAAIVSLKSSPFLKQRMKIKKKQTEYGFDKLNSVVSDRLLPILIDIEGVLTTLEETLTTTLTSVQSIFTVNSTESGFSSRQVADGDKTVSASVQDMEKLIEDMQSEVERLKKKYACPTERLPELMHTFKSHIDTAIFEPCDYSNVRLYNIACSSIVDEMEILFKDITFQLSDEDSGMKHTSFKIAQNIEENFKVLSEQVERGTL